MAHTKAGGSTSLGRDSHGKRLGVKLTADAYAKPGAIIVRQRGTKFRAGTGTSKGVDDTIFATVAGLVKFARRSRTNFAGKRVYTNIVSVVPKA